MANLAHRPIRVVLADDHPLVRSGIRTAIAHEGDIAIVGEIADAYSIVDLCAELDPDVLLLDLNMPGSKPTDTVRLLKTRCPQLKVLILTAYDDDAYVRGLLSAGVAGYVLKDDALDSIARAIRTVSGGGSWFSQSVLNKLVDIRFAQGTDEKGSPLTERDQELLAMISQGWDNGHIASELDLAEQTVRNYVSRLYQKLGLTSRAEAIIWARDNNWGR